MFSNNWPPDNKSRGKDEHIDISNKSLKRKMLKGTPMYTQTDISCFGAVNNELEAAYGKHEQKDNEDGWHEESRTNYEQRGAQ